MKVFRSFDIPNNYLDAVIAVGNFDGLHLGHQKVILEAKKISKEKKKKLGVLTFEPHPKCFFKKKFDFFRLSPFRVKYSLMKEIGVEFMLNIKFDSKLVNINAEDFVKNILIEKLKVFYIVTGFDFVFGNQQSGNVKTMKKLAELTKKFFFKEISEFKFGNNEISSSQIRKNLRNGNLNNANKILSRKWMVISRVIKGEKKAREIGFKTANLKINDYCNLLYGVYFVNVTILDSRIDNKFKGIANYGVKPTFTNNEPLLEVHLFDFDEEIYGKKLRIEFVKLVREEKKFESIEKLKDQIINDINKVKNDKLFQNN